MTEVYLGIRDLETGKIKKTLPSSWLVTAQRDQKNWESFATYSRRNGDKA